MQVGFHTGAAGDGDVVEWTFARSLLSDGVTAPTGDGDVQVWPSSSGGAPVVCLSLSSPSGKALFEVPLAELVEFLGQTYEAVPTGLRERPRRRRRRAGPAAVERARRLSRSAPGAARPARIC